jgi:hypothetical protein
MWRGGRVVEGAALEMLFRGNSNEGSNPSLSVLIPCLYAAPGRKPLGRLSVKHLLREVNIRCLQMVMPPGGEGLICEYAIFLQAP